MAIRPISIDQTASIIWHRDPAIDVDETRRAAADRWEAKCAEDPTLDPKDTPDPWREYELRAPVEPSCWRELFVMKAGEQPTEFVLRVIPGADMTRIEDDARIGTEDQRLQSLKLQCFMNGLTDIINGPTRETTDARGARVVDVPKLKTRDGRERVDPQWLEGVFSKGLRPCALFVGWIAWRWNIAGDDDVKN